MTASTPHAAGRDARPFKSTAGRKEIAFVRQRRQEIKWSRQMLTVYSRSGSRSQQEWFSTLIYIEVFERGQEGVGDDELELSHGSGNATQPQGESGVDLGTASLVLPAGTLAS